MVFGWNPPTSGAPNPAGQTLYSDTNRNIGIGTLSPSVKLEIYSTSSDSILKLSRQSATSTLFKVGTDSGFVINTNNADRLTISPDGNVGIGTTAPGAKLHVSVAINEEVFIGSAPNSVSFTPSSSGFSNVPLIDLSNGGTNGKRNIIMSTTNGLEFVDITGTSAWIFRHNGGEEAMRITSNGNVGIGTTAPSEKLEVSDRAKIDGVYIDRVTGANPTCVIGGPAIRKWSARYCYDFTGCGCPGTCTTAAGWYTNTPTCTHGTNAGDCSCTTTQCSADTYTEAVCIGN